MSDPRAAVPSVTAVLEAPPTRRLVEQHGHDAVVAVVRSCLDEVRAAVTAGTDPPAVPAVVAAVARRLAAHERGRTRGVVNATGVVLHTNLGRAALSAEAITAMVDAAGPATVEYDLHARGRARRGAHAGALLAELTGAEDALVVNNGAAALVLALSALAGGRAVVVSRGELVEIGGSFRLPAIVEAAGVRLVEVGTTNRTRPDDYAVAARTDDGVAAVLRVHPSNFRVEGFTARPTADELVAVARSLGVPLVHDVGSGLLHDDLPLPPGAADEPSLATAVADGADVVVASGDKLLGGPQAGLLVGTAGAVDACRRHPLARALRVDKVRLAALEATLEAHRRGSVSSLPTWAALTAEPRDLVLRADALVAIARDAGLDAERVELDALVGGGSLPGVTIPSVGVALGGHPDAVAGHLAQADPPVVGRVHDGRLVLDLRTVPAGMDDHLAATVRTLGAGERGGHGAE